MKNGDNGNKKIENIDEYIFIEDIHDLYSIKGDTTTSWAFKFTNDNENNVDENSIYLFANLNNKIKRMIFNKSDLKKIGKKFALIRIYFNITYVNIICNQNYNNGNDIINRIIQDSDIEKIIKEKLNIKQYQMKNFTINDFNVFIENFDKIYKLTINEIIDDCNADIRNEDMNIPKKEIEVSQNIEEQFKEAKKNKKKNIPKEKELNFQKKEKNISMSHRHIHLKESKIKKNENNNKEKQVQNKIEENNNNQFEKKNIINKENKVSENPILLKDNIDLKEKVPKVLQNENKINEQELELNEFNYCYTEFQIRLFCFEKKISEKIKNSSKITNIFEDGYIINNRIIEMYKDFFKSDILRNCLEQDNYYINTFNKYKNEYDYISQSKINDFIGEVMENIPKEYIKEIQGQDITSFKSSIQKIELYKPGQKEYNKDYINIINCNIINEKLGKDFFIPNIHSEELKNLFNSLQIEFMFFDDKLVIKYNLYIYIGNIGEKNIFNTDIMICFNENRDCEDLFYELENKSINDLLKHTKRIDKNDPNIGKLYNSNILIIILNDIYKINEESSPKKEPISNKINQIKNKIKSSQNPFNHQINKHKNIKEDFPDIKRNKPISKNIQNFNENENKLKKMTNSIKEKGKEINSNKKEKKIFQNQKSNNKKNIENLINEKQSKTDKEKIEDKIIDNEIKIIINIKIDEIKIRKKMSEKLNLKSKEEKYYLLNLNLFKKYLKKLDLEEIYDNVTIYKSIDDIISNYKDILTNEEIWNNIKQNPEIIKIINKKPIKNLIKNNLLDNESITPSKMIINNFYYYKDFILISENTEKLLSAKMELKYCYLGDNKIFVNLNDINFPQYLLGVYNLENNNMIIPHLFLQFNGEKEFTNSLNALFENGFKNYIKYNIILLNREINKDYPYPIIDSNNKKIGYAYRYNENIIGKNNEISTEIINEIDVMKEKKENINKIKRNKNENNINNIRKSKNNILTLQNVLSAIIDSKIILQKMSNSIKESKEENYFILNYSWFLKYLKLNQMTDLFHILVTKVESYIKDILGENGLNKKAIIEEIIKNLDKNIISKIIHTNDYSSLLTDKNSYQPEINSMKIKTKDYFSYYDNFILISSETAESFSSEFSKYNELKLNNIPVYFGSGRIFLINQSSSQNIIEIGVLVDNFIFKPKMFFKHNNDDNLKTNINLLLLNGFTNYQKYYLMFNDDNISPIFDMNNNKIGQAFRYKESINDYSNYILKEENIKFLFKLYYLNLRLKIKFNKKYNRELKQETYYIINENLLKELRNYSSLQNRLSQFDISKEVNEIMKSHDRETKFDELFDGKKFSIIIKNILSEKSIINDQNEINQNIMPNLASISCNGLDLFYYDNFRLIDCLLYNELKENKFLFYKSIKSTVSCIIIETYILINITNNNNSSGYRYIGEICEINEQNIIKPIYLLVYDEFKYLRHHLNYVLNIFGNFKGFLESLCFSQGNGIKLNLESSNDTLDVGYIYIISEVLSNQNINQNISNNNMNNIPINNSNIINFSNPNNNINVEVPICSPNEIKNNNINNNNSNNNNILSNQQIIVPPIPEQIFDSIEKEFTNHPLMGLKNVSTTCYMNVILQCFCNIKQFVNYFKYKLKDATLEKLNNEKELNLTSSFKTLIENLWQTPGNKYISPENNTQNENNKYYIPIQFKEKISKMNPLFERGQTNDAKDLVNFMIMTLHEELNKAPKNQNIKSSNLLINQSNQQEVFKNFLQNFTNENISLISDLFYAVNNNITECLNCHNKKYSYQIYYFLNFPLEEVTKFKIQNNQSIQANQNKMSMNQMNYQQNFINNNQEINSVNLDDCFRYNQKKDNFSGENFINCSYCQTQSSAFYNTIFTTGPEILIIILNRGKGNEFGVKCDFIEQLNLSEYIEMKNTGFMYNLIGVVTHIGESGPSGLFIAYCRSPIDNNWYQYNDNFVFPVKDFINEVINYAMPYILLYQKIK